MDSYFISGQSLRHYIVQSVFGSSHKFDKSGSRNAGRKTKPASCVKPLPWDTTARLERRRPLGIAHSGPPPAQRKPRVVRLLRQILNTKSHLQPEEAMQMITCDWVGKNQSRPIGHYSANPGTTLRWRLGAGTVRQFQQ